MPNQEFIIINSSQDFHLLNTIIKLQKNFCQKLEQILALDLICLFKKLCLYF